MVESPTASVCLLNRILVLDAAGDLDRVRAWRTGFTSRPLDGPLVDVEHVDLVHPDAQLLPDPWRFRAIGAGHLGQAVSTGVAVFLPVLAVVVLVGVALLLLLEPLSRMRRSTVRQTGAAGTDDAGTNDGGTQ